MKKLRKWIILTPLVLISILSIGIWAYFTGRNSMKNTIILGGVTVEVVETFEPPEVLEPGTSFTKDVKVQNLGPSDAYIRVFAVFSDSEMEEYCTVDWNTTDFIYNETDGYWYYTKKLMAEGNASITSSLFTTVTLSNEIPEDKIKDFEILIYAEGFQAEGFETYEDAWNYCMENNILSD